MRRKALIIVILIIYLTLPKGGWLVGEGISLPRKSSLFNPLTDYPVFELDEPMKEMVPRNFLVKYTAFSINVPINVSAYFRVGIENVLVYRELGDYFVNHEVQISAGKLENETQYEFIWEVRDSVGLFVVNVFIVEVDPTPPRIINLQLSTYSLVYGELIEVKYEIIDTHFESLAVNVDGENKAVWSERVGVDVLPWTVFVLPEGYLEKDFRVEFYAYDSAGNEAYANYTVHYLDNRFGYYDPAAEREIIIKAVSIGVGLIIGLAFLLVLVVGFWAKKNKKMAPKKVSGISLDDHVAGIKQKSKGVVAPGIGRRIVDFSRRKKE